MVGVTAAVPLNSVELACTRAREMNTVCAAAQLSPAVLGSSIARSLLGKVGELRPVMLPLAAVGAAVAAAALFLLSRCAHCLLRTSVAVSLLGLLLLSLVNLLVGNVPFAAVFGVWFFVKCASLFHDWVAKSYVFLRTDASDKI